MKSVKFKELPENVKRFLLRTSPNVYMKDSLINLGALHSEYDWSKATDEERLAYAEWKYPIGAKYVAVMVSDIRSGGKIHTAAHAPIATTVAPEGNTIEVGVGYVYSDATGWAEIVGESEKEEPKFKAGEVVSPNFYEGLPENMWITCDPYFYIGKRKNGKIAIENSSGSVSWCWGVRKIDKDPDKAYRAIAREIMAKEGIDYLGQYTHVGISSGKFESMLIEALKKGKEL